MNLATMGYSSLADDSTKVFANGICKLDMSGYAIAEECVFVSTASAVEELIKHYNVSWSIFLPEASNSSDTDDEGNAEGFKSPDVCSMVDLVWEDAVISAVTW